MNSINVTGTIQRVTTKQSADNEYCLGTIAVYRQSNKDTNKAIYDYIPFMAWGTTTVQRLQEGNNVALSGTLQSYLKDTGGQYKENILQLHVNHVDSFGTSSKVNQSEDAKGNPFEQKDDGLDIDDSMLPDNLFGGNN